LLERLAGRHVGWLAGWLLECLAEHFPGLLTGGCLWINCLVELVRLSLSVPTSLRPLKSSFKADFDLNLAHIFLASISNKKFPINKIQHIEVGGIAKLRPGFTRVQVLYLNIHIELECFEFGETIEALDKLLKETSLREYEALLDL
jgi:hypothetical protein